MYLLLLTYSRGSNTRLICPWRIPRLWYFWKSSLYSIATCGTPSIYRKSSMENVIFNALWMCIRVSSVDTFDNTGNSYDLKRILNGQTTIDIEAYRNYSPVYISYVSWAPIWPSEFATHHSYSVTFVIYYMVNFMSISCESWAVFGCWMLTINNTATVTHGIQRSYRWLFCSLTFCLFDSCCPFLDANKTTN